MTKCVNFHTQGRTGYVEFDNQDRLNAMSIDMWRQMKEGLERFAQDSSLRVVVLMGAGEKAFISGADISEFEDHRADAESREAHDAVVNGACQALKALSVPTIAKIDGWCIGGGTAVALCCDLRISSDRSRFGIPAAKLGIGYGYPQLDELVQHVGPAVAREILFTGMTYSAEEALQMGLVNRVFSVTEFENKAQAYVQRIENNAPLVIASTKVIVREICKNPEDRDIDLCREVTKRANFSEDFAEGRRAFMEKRPPVFTGR